MNNQNQSHLQNPMTKNNKSHNSVLGPLSQINKTNNSFREKHTKYSTYINSNTEGDYISWLKKKTLAKLRSCNLTGITNLNTGTNTNKLVSNKSCCTPFCNEIFRSHLQPVRFKTLYQKINYDWGYLRKSYTDDYLVTLNDNCSTNLDVFFVPNKSYNYPAVSHF